MAQAKKATTAKFNVRRETAGTSENGSLVRTKSTVSEESLSTQKSHIATKAIYRLKNGSEDTIQLIKSSHVVAMKDNGEYGFMRYCTNQGSIWEDEQREPFQRAQIVIEGEKVVGGESRNGKLLQEFLDRHPENGNLYYKIDPVKDAADESAAKELILDMQLKVRELASTDDGAQTLRETGAALGFKSAAAHDDIAVIKNKMYEFTSDANGASKFRDKLNDRVTRALALVSACYDNGSISYKNNTVRWAGSDDELIVVPTGKSWQNHLATFLASQFTTELWQEFEKASRG